MTLHRARRGRALRFVGVLAAAVACAGLAPRDARAQSSQTVAQQHLDRGIALYDQGSYEPALGELRTSLGLYSSPNARLYVARSLARLGRPVEAVREYETTAREAGALGVTEPRYVETREAAEREVGQVEPSVGRLRVDVSPEPAAREASRVQIAGNDVGRDALGLLVPVPVGEVRVRVESPGFEPAQFEVTVVAGERARVRAVLSPLPVPPPAASPMRVVLRPPARGAWPALEAAAFGVGLAGVTAFGALLVAAGVEYAALAQQCPSAPCTLSLASEVQTGVALQTAADVALVVGVAGFASALVAVLVERATGSRHAPRVEHAARSGLVVVF